jgi:hypothetical protein
MSTWIQALKIFNKDGIWCMPRKGTAEHAKVLDIMKKIKSGDQKRITDSASSKKALEMETSKSKLRTEKEKKETEMMAMEDRDVGKDEPIYEVTKTQTSESIKRRLLFFVVRGNKAIIFAEGVFPSYIEKLKKLKEVDLVRNPGNKRAIIIRLINGKRTRDAYADELKPTKEKTLDYLTITPEYVKKVRKIKEEWGKL